MDRSRPTPSAGRVPDGLGLQEPGHLAGARVGGPVLVGRPAYSLEVLGGRRLQLAGLVEVTDASEIDTVHVHVRGQPGRDLRRRTAEQIVDTIPRRFEILVALVRVDVWSCEVGFRTAGVPVVPSVASRHGFHLAFATQILPGQRHFSLSIHDTSQQIVKR
jgi:hypothetical protein